MNTRKRCMYFVFSISLILATLNFQTVFASAEVNLADSLDEAEIKSIINTYIQQKYVALHTLTLQNYSNLVSSVPMAITSFQSELEKLEIEIYHAQVNNLRYVQYNYFLDYKQITIDPLSNLATVSVTEGHDVVFEISDPIISTMRNLEHVITLNREKDGWKIVSDIYNDYLWRLLNATGATKEEIYKRIDQSKEMPTSMKDSDVRQAGEEQGTIESLLGTYDRSGAVDYAHDWAYDRNPSYFDFENYGGDCTNFVSQAMHEGGGISETASGGEVGAPGWYYVRVNDRAAAWTGVYSLYNFVINGHSWTGGPEGEEESTESYMYEGDIIQYDWGGEGTWDHSVIVVYSQQISPTYWYPYVAAHSDDVDNYPFSSYDYGDVRFLHITGY